MIGQFRRILGDLAANPSIIDAKAGPALRRAREQFTWKAKAEQVLAVYEWVTGERSEKPWFGMPLPDVD